MKFPTFCHLICDLNMFFFNLVISLRVYDNAREHMNAITDEFSGPGRAIGSQCVCVYVGQVTLGLAI